MTKYEMFDFLDSDINEINKLIEDMNKMLDLIYPGDDINVNNISVTTNNKLVFIMSEYRKNGLSFFENDNKPSKLKVLNEIILNEILFANIVAKKYLFNALAACYKLLTIVENIKSMSLKEVVKLKIKNIVPFLEDKQETEFVKYCDVFESNLETYKKLEKDLFKITIPDFIVTAINHYLTLSKFINYSDQEKMDFLYDKLYDELKLLKLEHIIDDLKNTGFDREFKMY